MKLNTNIQSLIADKKILAAELENLREFKCDGDLEVKWMKATIEHIDRLIDTYEYLMNEGE